MAVQKITQTQVVPIVEEAWIAPTFQNSWVNYDNDVTHNVAGYWKDSMGVVHLKGLVKSGTAAAIFTLPAGYRPYKRCIFVILSNGAVGRINLDPDGQVIPTTPYSNAWVSLDGITFRAYQ